MITIKKEGNGKFHNEIMALATMQFFQQHFALNGNLVTSSIRIQMKRIELTVHFDTTDNMVTPKGGYYSWKKTTSNEYYSDTLHRLFRVRATTFYFEY